MRIRTSIIATAFALMATTVAGSGTCVEQAEPIEAVQNEEEEEEHTVSLGVPPIQGSAKTHASAVTVKSTAKAKGTSAPVATKSHAKETVINEEVKIPAKIKKIYPLVECAIINMHESGINFSKGNIFAWTTLFYYANDYGTKTNKNGSPVMSAKAVNKYYNVLTGKKKAGKIQGYVKGLVKKQKGSYVFSGSDRGTATKDISVTKTKKGYKVKIAAITYPVKEKKDIYEADIRNGKIYNIKKMKNS